MKKRIARFGLLLAAALLALLASTALVACKTSSGGTVKAYASGTITAKGSIWVNGVEYNTSGATIKVNGLSATEADLKVGMHVELKGDIDTGNSTGVATEIESDNSLQGPISAIVSNDLTVLGQTVIVPVSGVSFEGTTGLGGATPLQVGDVVEVTAFPNGSGSFVATRIEKKGSLPGSFTFEIEGTISALAGQTDSSFTLTPSGGQPLTVNFTGTLGGGIANGSFVEVKFSTFTAPSTISTTFDKVELKQLLHPDDGDYVEVEGYVSGLAAPIFYVDGIKVDAGSLSLALVSNGAKVEVKGTFNTGTSTLMAAVIEVK